VLPLAKKVVWARDRKAGREGSRWPGEEGALWFLYREGEKRERGNANTPPPLNGLGGEKITNRCHQRGIKILGHLRGAKGVNAVFRFSASCCRERRGKEGGKKKGGRVSPCGFVKEKGSAG